MHQVPAGAIIPSTLPSALTTPLFTFSSVTQFLIPTQQFCDRLLTFCINHHRVIGYPVCIREGKYSRNEFIFNFAIVIGENERDWACYGEVVRKLGRLLRGLEEQGGFLSKEEVGAWDDEGAYTDAVPDDSAGGFGVGGGSKVYALCEMVLEDLNNYAECMIPIGECPPRDWRIVSSMLNGNRRFEYDQPKVISHTTASSTYPRPSSTLAHHLSLKPPAAGIFGSHTQSDTAVHQWCQFDSPYCATRRHRSLVDTACHTTSSILWLPGSSRHLQLRCNLRTDGGDWRIHCRCRSQGRMHALRQRAEDASRFYCKDSPTGR